MTKYNLHDKPHLIFNIEENGLNTDHKPPKLVVGTFNKTQAITSAHCSHILQPLDAGCFGPFQMAWMYNLCQNTQSNIQSSFRRCGKYPFDSTVINDSIVAPSTAFDHSTAHVTSAQQKWGPATSSQSKSAERFLHERGRKILENVQTSKDGNTLGKVVGGKAITEDTVTEKIKEHINIQITKTKANHPSKRSNTSKNKKNVPQQNTSGISNLKKHTRYVSLESSESENSDIDESEKCIICKRYQPADLDKYPYLVIVKWGRCDSCDGWMHLSFCTPIRVLRRGDSFYCPVCTHEQ